MNNYFLSISISMSMMEKAKALLQKESVDDNGYILLKLSSIITDYRNAFNEFMKDNSVTKDLAIAMASTTVVHYYIELSIEEEKCLREFIPNDVYGEYIMQEFNDACNSDRVVDTRFAYIAARTI